MIDILNFSFGHSVVLHYKCKYGKPFHEKLRVIGTNKSTSFSETISSSSHCRRVQTNWKVVFASVFRRSLSRPDFPPQFWINMQLTTSLNKHTGSASAEQSSCDQQVKKWRVVNFRSDGSIVDECHAMLKENSKKT